MIKRQAIMKRKFPSIFLLITVSMIILLLVSCGPALVADIETPTPGASSEMFATPILETPTLTAIQAANTTCPFEKWPCPNDSLTLTAEMAPTLAAMQIGTRDSLTMTAEMGPALADDSLTMTAAMGLTFAAIPSSTPLPWATIIPSVGDLGWGSVYGIIRDGITNLPIEGATIRCEHSSYISQFPCNGITTTNSDGIYAFTSVFFHDTDRITLFVEASGYTPLRFEQGFFTRPEFNADLGLFPVSGGTFTPTPYIMCTAPACSGGVLACGNPNGCTGGCGTVCLTKTPTPYLMCIVPICLDGVPACVNPNGCPGGCGAVCLTKTPTPYLMCTAPACVGGVLACGDPNGCMGGCGTICLTGTPIP
jgi:hypothetical protein